jgi:hypothetical protein
MVLLGGSRSRLPYTRRASGLRLGARSRPSRCTAPGLARQLLAAERFATLGRVGAGVHLGKPLGVVERLALRLQRRAREPALVQGGAVIAALAGEMRACLHGFLGTPNRARAPRQRRRSTRWSTARSAGSRANAAGSPSGSRPVPRLRAGGDELVRVLANLDRQRAAGRAGTW